MGLPGEFVFTVPSLTLPGLEEPPDPEELAQYESVRLFVERARIARSSFELKRNNSLTVSRLCRQLDGIPLAIELAASRLKVLPVEQIDAKLEDRFRLLTGGSEAALERHRTLRATVDWSYGLLSEAEKRIFRQLSVFAAGWTLEAATAVCGGGLDEFDMLDLLAKLNEKSLIFVDEATTIDLPAFARYRMHETMRHYGRELISPVEMPLLRDRHLDFYLGVAEHSAPCVSALDAKAWRSLMELENENLIEALRWALATDDGSGRETRLAGILRQHAPQQAR